MLPPTNILAMSIWYIGSIYITMFPPYMCVCLYVRPIYITMFPPCMSVCLCVCPNPVHLFIA